MGTSASAKLVYGLLLTDGGYDDEGRSISVPWWIEDKYGEENWYEDGLYKHPILRIVTFGHYANDDEQKAILTHKEIPVHRGDCWDPTGLTPDELARPHHNLIEETQKAINELGWGKLLGFPQAKWWLVASYG